MEFLQVLAYQTLGTAFTDGQDWSPPNDESPVVRPANIFAFRLERLGMVTSDFGAASFEHDAAVECELERLQWAEEEAIFETRRMANALHDARDAVMNVRTAFNASREAHLEEVRELERRLGEAGQRLESIIRSPFWRVTSPLRRLSAQLPTPFRVRIRRIARLIRQSARETYRFGGQRPGEREPDILQITDRETTLQCSRMPETYTSSARQQGPLLTSVVNRLSLLEAVRPVAMIVDAYWPRADQDSGSIDAMNLVEALKILGYDVVFTAAHDFAGVGPYRDALENMGVRCLGPQDAQSVEAFIEDFGSLVTLFVLSRYDAGGIFLETIRRCASRAKIVFNTVDLHWLRQHREASLNNDGEGLQRARQTRKREEVLVQQSDATIVVSKYEEELLRSSLPGARVSTLPLARVKPLITNKYVDRRHIGFIGGFDHKPNVDAVLFFLKEIWPIVRRHLVGCRFVIVGSRLPAEILNEFDVDVDYLGHVDKIDQWFDCVRLTVAPLRFGAGSKGKVVSSLLAGVPCICTPVAAEGMAAMVGTDIIVEATPVGFAEAIVKVYNDACLWKSLSDKGKTLLEQEHSILMNVKRLHRLLISLELPCITPTERVGSSPVG